MADARAGRPPYLWGVLFLRTERRAMLRQGATAIVKPFVVAVVIDGVLSYVTQGAIHPGQTLVVATCIVTLPYIAARAPTNRFVSYSQRRQASLPNQQRQIRLRTGIRRQ